MVFYFTITWKSEVGRKREKKKKEYKKKKISAGWLRTFMPFSLFFNGGIYFQGSCYIHWWRIARANFFFLTSVKTRNSDTVSCHLLLLLVSCCWLRCVSAMKLMELRTTAEILQSVKGDNTNHLISHDPRRCRHGIFALAFHIWQMGEGALSGHLS